MIPSRTAPIICESPPTPISRAPRITFALFTMPADKSVPALEGAAADRVLPAKYSSFPRSVSSDDSTAL